MTINSETRVAGPFDGNDSTVSFPFTFKVFDSDEVRVVAETGAVETDLELGTDYTVTLNADQNAAPGGSVVLVAPLATGTRLTLTSALEMLQPVDLTNQGGFYPRVINSALDRLTILLQQLASVVSRTLKFPLSDGPVGDLPGRSARAGTVLAFDEATGEPVAGPDISSVNGVAGALVAVNTVANNIADVNTVADNITDLSNFSGVYYGPSATDPTTRRDGSTLQVGDLYFNTVFNALRTYNGSVWRGPVTGTVTVQNLSGDGVKTAFLLDYAPESEVITNVFIGGVYQQKNTYALGGANGDVLIFNEAPPVGTNNIEVVVSSLIPSDDKLRQELAASTGAALIGYRSRDVERRLADTFSVADYGAEIGPMGNSPEADAQGIADSDPTIDTLKYGHLGVAKNLYGIRRNACAFSVRADANGDGEFDPQVVGVADTQGLANYNSNDVVGIFSDIVSHPYAAWEVISSGLNYQADGFTAPGLDFSRMRVGMAIKTDHATPWWALISGFDQPANKVRVIEWRQTGGNSAGTPAAGTGLKINPVSKQWALNTNLIFLPDSKAKLGVLAEYGVLNHGNTTGSGINGIDMVLLPASTYGGEAAFLARAPGAAKWLYGYAAQQSGLAGFYSTGSARGFVSEGDDQQGFVSVSIPAMMPNKSAFSCRSQTLAGVLQMNISASGHVDRMPFRTRVISDGMVMDTEHVRYLHSGGLATLNLPPVTETSLQNGDTFEIMNAVATGTISLAGNGRNVVAGGGLGASAELTGHKMFTVVYYDNVWYVA